ncbi:MAG: aminodeoxychorismate synthase component I [Sulfurimonas sp.]|jgi:para-aminobenzoate synthetase component 1
MKFKLLNSLGNQGKPFLFISDFKAENIEVILLENLHKEDVEFSISEDYISSSHMESLEKLPLPYYEYKKKFNQVIEKIEAGETYLLNLTQPTKIKTALTLKEIFTHASSHYKLRYKDKFVCFSPEKFIQIEGAKISTFPMKGTIDASIPNAEQIILNNQKEMAEHVMVVDLLRNDLSIVATDVKVEKFRYIESIEAGEKRLLQVSSHISGNIGDNWHERIGDILKSLLPAGSISGTPKKNTLKIIEETEGYERGFFSGVFGVYDGEKFDSGVMIRFIEKTEDGFIYKSGGGITVESDAMQEYKELLDKIYLP